MKKNHRLLDSEDENAEVVEQDESSNNQSSFLAKTLIYKLSHLHWASEHFESYLNAVAA